jgi:hypothetical protein
MSFAKMPSRYPACLLLALLAPSSAVVLGSVPMPRVAYQQALALGAKGSGSQSAQPFNVIFVAEDGHGVRMTRENICAQIGAQFELPAGPGALFESEAAARAAGADDVSRAVRRARGLALQHPSGYADAVRALESKLGEEGYYSRDFSAAPRGGEVLMGRGSSAGARADAGSAGANVYERPFKAAFLRRLVEVAAAARAAAALAAPALAAEPLTLCEVGCGAGHSALLFLEATAALRPPAVAYSFDTGLLRHTVPAHDALDAAFPGRLRLMLGDSQVVVAQLPHYYPDARCDLVVLDGAGTYNGTRADLSAFAPLVRGEGHVVALLAAADGSDAHRAWRDAEVEGLLDWEGTLLGNPSDSHGDALVYGALVLGGTASVGVAGP